MLEFVPKVAPWHKSKALAAKGIWKVRHIFQRRKSVSTKVHPLYKKVVSGSDGAPPNAKQKALSPG